MKGDCKILSDDLQGFWDLVMIQVDNVDESFKELQRYRDNGWKVRENKFSWKLSIRSF